VDVTGGTPGEPAVRVTFCSSVLASIVRWVLSGSSEPLKLFKESVEASQSLFGKIYVLGKEATPGGGAASRPVMCTLRNMRNVFESQVGWDAAEKRPRAEGYNHPMRRFESTFPGKVWFAGAPDAGVGDDGAVLGAGSAAAAVAAAATQPESVPRAGAHAGRAGGASAPRSRFLQQGMDAERRVHGGSQPSGHHGGANQGGVFRAGAPRSEDEQRRRSGAAADGGGSGGGDRGTGGGGSGGNSSGRRQSAGADGMVSTCGASAAGAERSHSRRRKRTDEYMDSSDSDDDSDGDEIEIESRSADEIALMRSAADPPACAVRLPPADQAARGIAEPDRFNGTCTGDEGKFRGGNMAKYEAQRASRRAEAHEAGGDDDAASAVVVQIAGAAPIELRGSSTALQRLLQRIDAGDRAHIETDDATLFDGGMEEETTQTSFLYSPFFIVSHGRGACAFTGTHAPHVLGADAAAVPVVILIDREEADAYAAHVQGAQRRSTHVLALLDRSGVPCAEGGVNVGHARASAHALAHALRLPRIWLHDDNVAVFKRWSPAAERWVASEDACRRMLQGAELTMDDNASTLALIGFGSQRNQNPLLGPSAECINAFVHKMVLLNVELTWRVPELRYSADKPVCGEDVAFWEAVVRAGLRSIKLQHFRWLRTSMPGGIRPALPQKQRKPKHPRLDATTAVTPSPPADEAPPPATTPRWVPRPQHAAATPPDLRRPTSASAAPAAVVDCDYDRIMALCCADHQREQAVSRMQRGLLDSLHAAGGAGALSVAKAEVMSCTELLQHLGIAQDVFLQAYKCITAAAKQDWLLDDGLRDVQKRMRRVLSDIARCAAVLQPAFCLRQSWLTRQLRRCFPSGWCAWRAATAAMMPSSLCTQSRSACAVVSCACCCAPPQVPFSAASWTRYGLLRMSQGVLRT